MGHCAFRIFISTTFFLDQRVFYLDFQFKKHLQPLAQSFYTDEFIKKEVCGVLPIKNIITLDQSSVKNIFFLTVDTG